MGGHPNRHSLRACGPHRPDDGRAGTGLRTGQHPPTVANEIQNQTATVGTNFSSTVPANTFADAGDTLTYSTSALPTWLTFNPTNREFTGTPMAADLGRVAVEVTASDSSSASASDTFSIVVEGDIADQTANVAEAFNYTVPAGTFAGASTTGKLTYSARLTNGRAIGSNTQLAHGRIKPGWLRFNGSTRTFSGTPLPGSDGTMSVRVTAYDEAGKSVSATFDITVVDDSGLVGNFTRPGTTGRHLVWFDHAQKFTTGADTAGYTVTSIDVLLRDVHSNSNFPTVSIRSGASPPGTEVATLQTPMSGASGGDKPYRYTAPANLALAANTSYWVVLTGGSSSIVRMTGWTIIDAGSAAGWSIESKTYRSNIQYPRWSQGPNSSATSLRINGMTTGNQQAAEPPTVTDTPAVSGAGEDGQWGPGETVEVSLTFSEAVRVEPGGGTPDIGIGLDLTEARRAAYASGTGTDTLVFAYTLDKDDGNRSSMGVTPNSLTLNGGSIRSVATGVDAVLDHNGAAVQGSAGRTPTGPTASFSSLPGDHGGSPFTFALGFSAEPEGLSYRTVRAGLLNVEGGTVTKAVRSASGSNQDWRVTVAPSGSDDVRIELPNRACGEANAICIGGQPLANAVSTTVPHDAAVAPLTASFSGAPSEHDGTSAFELEFALSEAPAGLSYKTVHNGLFDVIGGRIARAWRLTGGQNKDWGLRVEPAGFGAVTLTVRATTDCTGTPGVCATDGRMLAGGLAATIEGPPTLSVADAGVEEASDAALVFTVTLSRELSETVTVEYRTEDGTAGADYTTATGTLTFTPGQTTTTVSVPVLDDSHDDGSETMTLRLLSPTPARVTLADAEATGTITNSDPLPQAWLGRFGRSAAVQVVTLLDERFEAAAGGDTRLVLGGRAVDVAALRTAAAGEPARRAQPAAGCIAGIGTPQECDTVDRAPLPGAGTGGYAEGVVRLDDQAGTFGQPGVDLNTVPGDEADPALAATPLERALWTLLTRRGRLQFDKRQFISQSSFDLSWAHQDGAGISPDPADSCAECAVMQAQDFSGRWSLWGRGALMQFSGRDRAINLSGDVLTGLLGVDYARARWLAGAALAYHDGNGSYSSTRDGGTSALDSVLVTVNPYLRYALTERLSVWGTLGYGAGADSGGPDIDEVIETDLRMGMGALGLRGVVYAGEHTEWALKSDALWVRTSSAETAGMQGARADTSRLRLLLSGQHQRALAHGALLSPGVELGLRYDDGDAETGFGLELGGGLRYADSVRGLIVETKARALLAHEDGGYEEWGLSGSLALDPGRLGRGLALRLDSGWGVADSGAEALWQRQSTAGIAPQHDSAAQRRITAELGYGLDVPYSYAILTPYGGVEWAGSGRTLRLGWRFALGQRLSLSLDGERTETRHTPPEHALMLRTSLPW